MSPISSTLANASAYGYRTLAAAAGTAYESIASATGTGSSNTITFSSIPNTYASLQIRGIARSTDTGTAANGIGIRMNGSNALDYTYHRITGDGTSVTAIGVGTGGVSRMLIDSAMAGGSMTANTMGAVIFDLHDYASTTKYKTARSFAGVDSNAGSTNDNLSLVSNLWLQTTAVTSITIVAVSGNFTTSTSFALYGIKGA